MSRIRILDGTEVLQMQRGVRAGGFANSIVGLLGDVGGGLKDAIVKF